jgi:NADH dehydrogenase FAD-containing subunit
VAIVGGGFAGVHIAKYLDKDDDYKVILIDNKEYFEYSPTMLRALFTPEDASSLIVHHSNYLHNGEFVLGVAEELQTKKVKVSGRWIDFDYCVVCTGCRFDSLSLKEESLNKGLFNDEQSLMQNKRSSVQRSRRLSSPNPKRASVSLSPPTSATQVSLPMTRSLSPSKARGRSISQEPSLTNSIAPRRSISPRDIESMSNSSREDSHGSRDSSPRPDLSDTFSMLSSPRGSDGQINSKRLSVEARARADTITLQDPKRRFSMFDVVYEDVIEYRFFKNYCKERLCMENLMFIEAVDEYHRLFYTCTKREMRQLINFVKISYLTEGAKFEVNMSSIYRENLLKQIAEIEKASDEQLILDEKLFDQARAHVVANLNDVVSSFTEDIERSSKTVHVDYRMPSMLTSCESVKNAKSIVIIGGGPLGVDVAARIVSQYPEKRVTIVHGKSSLIHYLGKKASKVVTNFLVEKGVQLRFNERAAKVIALNAKQSVLTDRDELLEADQVFICGGSVGNTDFMHKYFGHVLTEHGKIQVNQYLQVKGHAHLFAVGDVTDIHEERSHERAIRHADLFLANIARLEAKRSLKGHALELLKPKYIISLGTSGAMMISKDKSVTVGNHIAKLHASTEKKFLSDLKTEVHKKKRKRRISALSSGSDRSNSPVRISSNTNLVGRNSFDELELSASIQSPRDRAQDNLIRENTSPLQSPKKKRVTSKSADGPGSHEKMMQVPSVASIPEEVTQ